MESLVSALVFLLPGFLAYFWLQAFGQNPVVKHTPAEFTTISALLWLPVSFFTIIIYNTIIVIAKHFAYIKTIWSLQDLKDASNNLSFLIVFLLFSALVSFIFSYLWIRFVQDKLNTIINKVRASRKLAPLSDTTSVWEEFWIRINDENTTEKIMVLKVYKADKSSDYIVGSMIRASRPYEAEKAFVLADTAEWKDELSKYDFPIKQVYYDLKNGLVIEELDYKEPILKKTADNQDASENNKK